MTAPIETGGPAIEAALAILTEASVRCDPSPLLLPAPYCARLERAGAYTDRQRRDLIYRRDEQARRLHDRLPYEREQRSWARAVKETEASKRRANELYMRRERLYQVRFRAIVERVQAEHHIRPKGKSNESYWRWKRQIEAALDGDPGYRELQQRNRRADDRHRARQSRRGMERIEAGVLAVDDREIRRRKVEAYRTQQAGG